VRIVGLLRGINVGTSVKVPMKELKALLEELGATRVVTYLNSGNVIFDSDLPLPALSSAIEAELERRFGERIPILLLDAARVIAIRDSIPPEWENSEREQTYVAYLFPEVDRPSLIPELPVKHQYIDMRYVPSAIIWNIKRADYNRSQITKIAGHESYGRLTTRNVNTARKLAVFCES
jgi:uncharacterized protein (DUF1697 family)